MQDVLGTNMVPAVYLNGYYIGGWTQLTESWNDGSLESEYADWVDHANTCVNDDSVGDSYGDLCSNWYTGENLAYCGDYDTAEFVANEMCCECAALV